jgi:hypothetical protein
MRLPRDSCRGVFEEKLDVVELFADNYELGDLLNARSYFGFLLGMMDLLFCIKSVCGQLHHIADLSVRRVLVRLLNLLLPGALLYVAALLFSLPNSRHSLVRFAHAISPWRGRADNLL